MDGEYCYNLYSRSSPKNFKINFDYKKGVIFAENPKSMVSHSHTPVPKKILIPRSILLKDNFLLIKKLSQLHAQEFYDNSFGYRE